MPSYNKIAVKPAPLGAGGCHSTGELKDLVLTIEKADFGDKIVIPGGAFVWEE